jgi:hypothetical protein
MKMANQSMDKRNICSKIPVENIIIVGWLVLVMEHNCKITCRANVSKQVGKYHFRVHPKALL